MKIFKLIVSLAVCGLAAFAGSLFTTSKIPTWYAGLNKPFFTPPNWLFAPAWTTLYVLMGISLYLVWQKGTEVPGVKKGMTIFLVQLVFNSAWSIVFFGLESPLGGVAVIVVLWVAILLTMIQFFKLSKAAGWLLVPYLAWVSFASALNVAVFILNR